MTPSTCRSAGRRPCSVRVIFRTSFSTSYDPGHSTGTAQESSNGGASALAEPANVGTTRAAAATKARRPRERGKVTLLAQATVTERGKDRRVRRLQGQLLGEPTRLGLAPQRAQRESAEGRALGTKLRTRIPAGVVAREREGTYGIASTPRIVRGAGAGDLRREGGVRRRGRAGVRYGR